MPEIVVDFLTTDFTPHYGKIDLERVWDLIDDEVARFVGRTPKSAAIFAEAKESMINGTPNSWWSHWMLVDPRTEDFLLPHLWYWDRGKHQRGWDADGNEYLDYMFADTPTIWGHAPDDAFTRGITEFIQNTGLCTMIPTEDAVVATKLLQQMIDLKYWYITLSASDALRNAISIARTVTRRPNVLTHHLGYMGLNEESMYWRPIPDGPIMPRWAHLVPGSSEPQAKLCEFNDIGSVEAALREQDVAIFVTEPLMTDNGFVVPEPGYLEAVQELCRKYGTLLLIDETHTLAHGPRGLYTEMRLEADMWVTGKAIAGGIACGVLGMSEDLGDRFAAKLNDFSVPWGVGAFVGQGTTVSANSLSVRALRLALEHYYTEETYNKMVGAMNHLCAGLREVIAKHDVPFSITQSGARMHLNFIPGDAYTSIDAVQAVGMGGYHEYFTLFALNRGFVVMPWFNMVLTSQYTTTQDNDAFIEMFDQFVSALLGNEPT